MKIVNVVAAIIENNQENDGRILIAQRDSQSDFVGYWEFPGGKINSNETHKQALCRELNEEPAINNVEITDYIATSKTHQAKRIILLHAWRIVSLAEKLSYIVIPAFFGFILKKYKNTHWRQQIFHCWQPIDKSISAELFLFIFFLERFRPFFL